MEQGPHPRSQLSGLILCVVYERFEVDVFETDVLGAAERCWVLLFQRRLIYHPQFNLLTLACVSHRCILRFTPLSSPLLTGL